MVGMPMCAPDTTFTIEPEPWASMGLTAWPVQWSGPRTLTSTIARALAGSNSSTLFISKRAALFIRPSIFPYVEMQVSIRRPASDQSVMSATQATARPPSASISAATASASGRSTSLITSDAPWRAMPLAQAAPIPLPEPVTTTALPSRMPIATSSV